MRERKPSHWGEWIAERAQLLGIVRQRDLAQKIGCSENQLSRWVQMPAPPKQMRKGFDRTLARALMTTRDVLFSEYANIAPADTAQLMLHPDHVYPLPSNPTDELFLTEALDAAVARLHDDERAKVAEYTIQLVLSKNDARRAEFERLRDRAIMDAPEKLAPHMFPAARMTADRVETGTTTGLARLGDAIRSAEVSAEATTLSKSGKIGKSVTRIMQKRRSKKSL